MKHKLSAYVRITQTECVFFFFTNFPTGTGEGWFRRCFGEYGDVFIPRKRRKEGKSFGFVRYWNVVDVEELLLVLKEITVGNLKLRVNVSRFRREDESLPKSPAKFEGRRRSIESPAFVVPGVSFRDAISNKEYNQHGSFPALSTPLPQPPRRRLMFEAQAERLEEMSRYWVASFKSLVSPESFIENPPLGDFFDIHVVTLGGGWFFFAPRLKGHYKVSPRKIMCGGLLG